MLGQSFIVSAKAQIRRACKKRKRRPDGKIIPQVKWFLAKQFENALLNRVQGVCGGEMDFMLAGLFALPVVYLPHFTGGSPGNNSR
jgi:hypothetical protein